MQSEIVLEPQLEEVAADHDRTILIVEDNPEIADVLAIRLEKQGYRSLRADSGSDGLQMAREMHPHLVLMDIHLPDVDGLSICQKLDDDPETCEIPVIILSGMDRPDIIRRARTAGSSFYVRKPYDPNALLLLIEEAIRQTEDPDTY